MLKIYHVSSLNRGLEWLGVGLYHTSLALYGFEFSFGGHDSEDPGTIIVQEGNSGGLKLKEAVPLGTT